MPQSPQSFKDCLDAAFSNYKATIGKIPSLTAQKPPTWSVNIPIVGPVSKTFQSDNFITRFGEAFLHQSPGFGTTQAGKYGANYASKGLKFFGDFAGSVGTYLTGGAMIGKILATGAELHYSDNSVISYGDWNLQHAEAERAYHKALKDCGGK